MMLHGSIFLLDWWYNISNTKEVQQSKSDGIYCLTPGTLDLYIHILIMTSKNHDDFFTLGSL